MTRHIYTEALAPLNTGSIERPARFNLRLTCQARARTHKALGEKRMPAEIRTLQADERIVVTSRVGRDGVKYAGTPKMMIWWTSREDGLGSAKETK